MPVFEGACQGEGADSDEGAHVTECDRHRDSAGQWGAVEGVLDVVAGLPGVGGQRDGGCRRWHDRFGRLHVVQCASAEAHRPFEPED